MKFDLNEAIRDVLDFVKERWKPSLAKYIIVPSMTVGLGALSIPLWVDIINWILVHQNFLPDYKLPIALPNYPLGISLIILSIIIYFIDSWMKKNGNNPDEIKKLPQKVASEVAEHLNSNGFTAPHLQDEKIETLLKEITMLRFFGSFPKEEKSSSLAESIIDGELSGGTPQKKAKALALLARYLCSGERVEQAKYWLSISKKLCPTEESEIAQAFIHAVLTNNVDEAYSSISGSSPSKCTARFMIKKIVDGLDSAISWFESSGLRVDELDIDGKAALVSALLSERQWEKALHIAKEIDNESLSMSPALAQLSAFAFLVNAIKAVELRESVLNYTPFAAARFPLADDTDSIALRNRAVELFKKCSSLAVHLGAEEVANVSDNYALWLELRNNETYDQAKIKLQSYFVNYSKNTLNFLPLAFDFGIKIDFDFVEKEVNRQAALSHSNNPILGLARFVLAQTKSSFPAVVEYISRYRNEMEKAVNPIAIGMLEIEALARSGLVDDAERLLKKIEDSDAPGSEVRSLQNIIGSAKGKDSVALAISQYQRSKATSDLSYLVTLLERENPGEKYYLYCRELFDCTGQESDAIRVCNAASSLGKFCELHQFLLDRMDIVKRSDGLQAHWAWSLFRKGDLNGAQEQIALLKQSKSQQTDLKELEINLSIFSGDWESLSVFVEDSWNSREKLKAADLLQAAQLAKAVSPGRTRQILEFCTGKYPNDPQVLASSYFTATTMGWEESQETSEWLNKAVVLSDDDGPLHKASLEDLKGMISDAKEKNDYVYKAYVNGDAPVFTVAELLNRTMSDFYLIQPLENKKTKDLRLKNLVPVFNSGRMDQVIAGDSIAVDLSSALVLENIGLLKYLFDCSGRIFISHSFMRLLFEEKQKVAYHQPSQIKKAKYFERLVSDGKISVFHPNKINNPELALDVGDELAFMLEQVSEHPTNESQTLIVCSFPVYKVGDSLRSREVDLSSFHHSLISCSQLIKKLEELAVITATQCDKALNYLRQHEKEWPTDLEVASGAKLFVDSLSITYLITVDMLEKLSDAGFEVYVFKRERDRYRSLINYDSIINQADSKIENIRKLFYDGLASGKVFISQMPLNKDRLADSNDNYTRSVEEFFETLHVCDAALIDDRFMNGHRNIALEEKTVPIFTSLDFIETLNSKKIISQEQKFEARTLLRESGFSIVGISTDELEYHLNKSVISDGEFKPTKQLRLIRENLILIRISDLVQLPRDAQWLHETLKTIAKVIMAQWRADIPLELSRARSCWLYELLGYREWAQAHHIRDVGGMAYIGEVLMASSILFAPEYVSGKEKEDYQAWLDEFVLEPLMEIDPWSYQKLIDSLKQQVKSISHQPRLEENLDG